MHKVYHKTHGINWIKIDSISLDRRFMVKKYKGVK